MPAAAGAHPQNVVVAVEVSHGFPVQHAPLPGSVFNHSTGVHALPEATEKSLLHHVHNQTLAEVSFRHKEIAGVRYEVSPPVRRPAAPFAAALAQTMCKCAAVRRVHVRSSEHATHCAALRQFPGGHPVRLMEAVWL